MPLPASVPTITVTGTFYKQTGLSAGAPAAGTITFASPQLRVAADNTILPRQSFTATLDANGAFSVVLLVTDPSYYVGSPSWAYAVSATLTDATFTSNDYQFPSSLGATVDLADVNPVTDPTECDIVTCASQEEVATLEAQILQEIADRIAADLVLQGNLDAEEAARIAADILLQGNIDTEVAARIAADLVLQNNITAEAAARAAADAALQAEIDAITAGIVTSIIAGIGIDVSSATGNVTVSVEFGTGANQVPQANTVVYLTGIQTAAGAKTWSDQATFSSGAVFTGTGSIDAAGVAALGAKNSNVNLRFAGKTTTAGAPIANTWAQFDLVLDVNGVWWLCTVGGTPGTWVTGTVNLVGTQTAAGDKTWSGYQTIAAAASGATAQLKIDPTTPTDGTWLLYFDTEQPWVFKQVATGASAALALFTTASAKQFQIRNSNDVVSFNVLTGSTGLALTTIDGGADIGGKNSTSKTQLRGRGATAGPPTTGTWATSDTVQDVNGRIWYCTAGGTPGNWVSSGSPQIDVIVGGASGNWSKPTGATLVDVTVVGGGGGGGSGRRGAALSVRCGGGGGAGGGWSRALMPASALPSSVPYSVGGAGSGGAVQTADNNDGFPGTGGGASVFNDTVATATSASRVRAAGGGAGSGGTNATGLGGGSAFAMFSGAGGAAASVTGGTGVVGPDANGGAAAGASGGGITNGDSPSSGGAGGVTALLDQTRGTAGAQPGGSGGAGKSALGVNGGNGGGGGAGSITGVAGAGGAGGTYGGGGGGGGASLNGNNSGAGGAGAAGAIIIVTYF